ncbi:hypothetical protein K1X12_06090 [Hyphomonas sp. WL0036]|uniref:hypothetical protein n=1 Tax=Hyphomonas sediminis TaxID=2866160 RepID=UPI001C7FD892|nr:hypothetical protein [Hyphomonas sediminis]MBY9066459.1 hypothetical protein [Hyphomonas sediminis]
MKPFTAAALGALSILFVCGAASAQSAKSVNEAFQAGRSLGVSPVTADEMTLCAAYWEVWRQSAERDWEPSFIDALDPALTAEEADFASYYWANEAQATYEDQDGDLSAYEPQVTIAVDQATEAYDRLMLLMPEPLKIFETLGTCQIP